MTSETMASRDQWNADRTDGIFWALEYTTGDRIEWLVNRHGQMTQDIHEAMHFQSSFDADVARRGLAHPFDRAKVVQHAMIARAAQAPTMDAIEAVARAVCVSGGYDPDERMPNDGPRWKYYVTGAEAALSAARPFIAAEWQPIETAPKDGTLVLFHTPGKRPFMGRADDYWSGMAVYLDGVTHWHPTPAPPTTQETIR